MACFCPIAAWQPLSGGKLFFKETVDCREIEIACGQCIGCRLEYSRQWAVRCVHEAQMHKYSCFVTLTYDNDNVPSDGSLRYSDFQKFMKRLRKYAAAENSKVRFVVCGEYGETTSRPHFHALLFGLHLADKSYFRRLASGYDLYTSDALSALWPLGFSSFGDVTFDSAAYVARYCLKKVTGDAAMEHYKRVSEDGEIYWLHPELLKSSLKPAIGDAWFRKYRGQIYPRDYVVINGRKVKPPRRYDILLKAENSFVVDDVEADRFRKAMAFIDDCTSERLRVRETVARARLSFKKRSLE